MAPQELDDLLAFIASGVPAATGAAVTGAAALHLLGGDDRVGGGDLCGGDDLFGSDDLFGGDDLPDFLASEPVAPPRPEPLHLQQSAGQRSQRAAQIVTTLSDVNLADLVTALGLRRHAEALSATDVHATWAVLESLRQADGDATAANHGPLSGLIARAIVAGDIPLSLLAMTVAARLGLGELQDAIAQQLRDRAPELAFAGVETALDCLATLADGRCVRTMEEALLRQSAALTEHQAWRARHIVQLIRRDHRR